MVMNRSDVLNNKLHKKTMTMPHILRFKIEKKHQGKQKVSEIPLHIYLGLW